MLNELIMKNWKKEIMPFVIVFIILFFIEQYLSKESFLMIALSVFWKLSLIFLIRFLYIEYIQPKK